MIHQFTANTALLLIDVQQGVNDCAHWGGATGRRNNPDAEAHLQVLLACWRMRGLPVVYTQHDSRQQVSPLKLSLPGGAFMAGLEPRGDELVIRKDVNSAFIGTMLELELRRRSITRLVVAGFFTNFCVETTVRMAGNMGYDTYLAHDACATTNRIGVNGEDYAPEVVHAMAVASMHREFCTALAHHDLIRVAAGDVPELERRQANE